MKTGNEAGKGGLDRRGARLELSGGFALGARVGRRGGPGSRSIVKVVGNVNLLADSLE